MSEDLDALLGINTKEIVRQSTNIKHELKTLDDSELRDKVVNETNEIMDSAKVALAAVLDEVQATPNDAALIESASKLITAQSGLIDALSKLHLANEKIKSNERISEMRVMADQRMNSENNQTKVLLSREEIMSKLIADSKESKVIEINN